jgi:hypothetical protein
VAFSGFLVPAGDMPGAMRALSYVSSVQHYLVILRSVMLRGAGIGLVWLPALALAGISSAILGLAWLRLRVGLDPDSLQKRLMGASRHLRRRWFEERPALRPGKSPRRSAKPGLSGEPA